MSRSRRIPGGPLYAIFDPAQFAGDSWPAAVTGALAGGVSMLQLRCKSAQREAAGEWARRLHEVTAAAGVPLIINDDPAVAGAAGAEGVHLGASDMAPGPARALLGPDAIIGLTIHSGAEARQCDVAAADYFGVGPFAATGSKADASAPLGEAGFAELCALLKARAPGKPIYAIAGIDALNARRAIAAGADGVAVISAIFSAGDTRAAARRLSDALSEAGAGRWS